MKKYLCKRKQTRAETGLFPFCNGKIKGGLAYIKLKPRFKVNMETNWLALLVRMAGVLHTPAVAVANCALTTTCAGAVFFAAAQHVAHGKKQQHGNNKQNNEGGNVHCTSPFLTGLNIMCLQRLV
jgi:hypothetical protein